EVAEAGVGGGGEAVAEDLGGQLRLRPEQLPRLADAVERELELAQADQAAGAGVQAPRLVPDVAANARRGEQGVAARDRILVTPGAILRVGEDGVHDLALLRVVDLLQQRERAEADGVRAVPRALAEVRRRLVVERDRELVGIAPGLRAPLGAREV